MTYLVERAAELRRHLDHLRELRPRVESSQSLRRDLSLHNDVLFSLQMVCQLVIDVAGELSSRKGLRFGDYTEAVRNLAAYEGMSDDTVAQLALLPGFRNVLVHEYAALDLDRAVAALDALAPVDALVEILLHLGQEGAAGEV